MYRVILVALDGSQREPAIFHAATELAARFGAQLHVCRAVAIPIGLPDAVWAVASGDLEAALLADAQRSVEHRIAASPLAIAKIHISLGHPADVVTHVAEQIAADLVVIGSHGYGPLERLIGTTASKIVHRAVCSVLVVRESA
jgi:universal stress protein F